VNINSGVVADLVFCVWRLIIGGLCWDFYGRDFTVSWVRNQVQIVVFEDWMNCWKLERQEEKIDLGIAPNFLKHHA
jgi:hypothetical protein